MKDKKYSEIENICAIHKVHFSFCKSDLLKWASAVASKNDRVAAVLSMQFILHIICSTGLAYVQGYVL